MAGSLPEIALGQIWELKVRRVGEKLTVVNGQPYQPSAEDLVWLEQQRRASIQSKLPAPILKQQPPVQMQGDTTVTTQKSSPVLIAKEVSDVVPQVSSS